MAVPLPAVSSENVRLRDVDSPLTQSGMRCVERGDTECAERWFQAAVEAEPDSASGTEASHERRPAPFHSDARALKSGPLSLRLCPSCACARRTFAAYSNLGNIKLQRGLTTESLAAFDAAVLRAPTAAIPRLNRSLALSSLGRYADALADCAEAVRLDPLEPAAHYNAGEASAKLGLWEEARAYYRVAADLEPGLAGYRFKEALALYELGRDREAVALLRGVARKLPQYAEAHAALAAAMWAQGRPEAAETAFASAAGDAVEGGAFGGFGDRALRKAETYGDAAKGGLGWPPRLRADMEKFLKIDGN